MVPKVAFRSIIQVVFFTICTTPRLTLADFTTLHLISSTASGLYYGQTFSPVGSHLFFCDYRLLYPDKFDSIYLENPVIGIFEASTRKPTMSTGAPRSDVLGGKGIKFNQWREPVKYDEDTEPPSGSAACAGASGDGSEDEDEDERKKIRFKLLSGDSLAHLIKNAIETNNGKSTKGQIISHINTIFKKSGDYELTKQEKKRIRNCLRSSRSSFCPVGFIEEADSRKLTLWGIKSK